MQTRTGDHDTVYLKKAFNHPAETVFHAFIQPELIRQWFGPPGMETISASVNPVPGGKYRFGLQRADGIAFSMEGKYRIVDPPHRLEFTMNYVGIPNPIGESLVSIRFNAVDQGTEVLLKQAFTTIPANMEGRTQAWELMFERIPPLLKGIR